MTHAEASSPATRGHLDATAAMLRGELQATAAMLRGEIKSTADTVRGELKSDIKTTTDALRGELKAVETRLDGKIEGVQHRLAKAIVQTQSDIRGIQQTMKGLSTKEDIQRILSAIDSFAGKAQSYDRAAVLHGHSLTEVQAQVKDHEGRIKALESGRS
ncbi:MAG: hypothetical protein HY927_06380 [Elusimicrobia bacterium]|nr:hypothetical protein [Elusimicrobiota bacterium]